MLGNPQFGYHNGKSKTVELYYEDYTRKETITLHPCHHCGGYYVALCPCLGTSGSRQIPKREPWSFKRIISGWAECRNKTTKPQK